MKNTKVYTIEEIRKICIPIFQKKDYINKVYLFGSYARNEATSISDIDFAVFLSNKKIGLEFYSLYEMLSNALNKKVDVLCEEEINRIMKKAFDKDKVLIYVQQDHLL